MENQEKKDRVKEYLTGKLDGFLFDELSPEYLKKAEITDFMKGVPIPIKTTELSSASFSTVQIADSMAYVLGCDPDFRYRDAYLKYIEKFFPEQFPKLLVQQGADQAKDERFEEACVYFRAALIIDPDFRDAQYCYARACHDAYEHGEGEEYVGTFKAESLRAFETLAEKWPDFDEAYYFLGYAYLNLGLYQKAQLTFNRFLNLNQNEEARKEIQQMQEKLAEPCRIEEGCNAIASGRFESGIEILEPYRNDPRYNAWWPLWYYLGVAFRGIGLTKEATDAFQRVLTLSPSNIETMQELVDLYEANGLDDLAEKYQKKIDVVRHNQELDREQKRQEEGITVS